MVNSDAASVSDDGGGGGSSSIQRIAGNVEVGYMSKYLHIVTYLRAAAELLTEHGEASSVTEPGVNGVDPFSRSLSMRLAAIQSKV